MALPLNRPLNIISLFAYMADSGSASSVYIAVPVRAKVVKLSSTLQGTVVATADNAFTAFINATAITHPTWVQATSGSAAGDVSEVTPSAANQANAGDFIKVTSDGAGTNTTPTMIRVDLQVN